MNKIAKCIIAIAICLLAVCLYVIFPGTKTVFPCYALFRATADEESYLKCLPESAHDMKYYVKEGLFKEKSGYRMILSSEDYGQAKQEILEIYSSEYLIDYAYCYDGGTKRLLNPDEMEMQQVGFIKKLIYAPESFEEYYILTELPTEGNREEMYCGAICNDSTYEIIEFTRYQYAEK